MQDPMTINPTNLLVRFAILATAGAAIVCFYLWGYRTGRKLEALAGILWLVNVFTFQVARLLMLPFSIEFLNNWSLGIQLHCTLSCAIASWWLAKSRKL